MHACRTGRAIEGAPWRDLRARAIFECHKWDPQVGDTDVLCPYPLLLDAADWSLLATTAEHLAREAYDAESELLQRPDLWRELGLPRRFERALRTVAPSPSGAHIRVARFDFHPTRDGWALSEINSDVPGGFIEAEGFTALMHAASCSARRTTGAPATALARALLARIGSPAGVALVHASAYTDDRQVMVYLADTLHTLGITAHLVSPKQILWRRNTAAVRSGPDVIDVAAIVRFFPAEWLPNLGRDGEWRAFLRCASPTVLCNPATALLIQSKRLPLIWDRLQAPMDHWKQWLPQTVDPRRTTRDRADQWVLKPTLGRVGAGVAIHAVTPPRELRRARHSARWFPRHWVAQRRFDAAPIETPDGPGYPCVGVYVIDAKAAGAYARIAHQPLIDHRARDIAVLINDVSRSEAIMGERAA